MAGVVIVSKEVVKVCKKIVTNKQFQRNCIRIWGAIAGVVSGIFCGKGVSNVMEYNRQSQ